MINEIFAREDGVDHRLFRLTYIKSRRLALSNVIDAKITTLTRSAHSACIREVEKDEPGLTTRDPEWIEFLRGDGGIRCPFCRLYQWQLPETTADPFDLSKVYSDPDRVPPHDM